MVSVMQGNSIFPFSQSDFDFLRQMIQERSAIVIEPSKAYLVNSRLSPLVVKEGLASIEELVFKMRSKPDNGLNERVIEALTTNETSFFRDPAVFEAMKTMVLPDIIKKRQNSRRLNIWCGASSSGQECYSILMLIKEHFPELLNWKLYFTASDISQEMLARCRSGNYSQLEINRGLPAPMLVKYFEQDRTTWTIKKEIRDLVDFQQVNLAEPLPSMPAMDIVFLRNVLIYFDVETKKNILRKIKNILCKDGYLFLGAAETTFYLDDAFQPIQPKLSGSYKLKG